MTIVEKNEMREYRIVWGITVDAYDEKEKAMGWYYYLEHKLHVPFHARCICEKQMSPLVTGEVVKVLSMASERDCLHEMWVEVQWGVRKLKLPLSQLKPINADEITNEAVEDWHYWIARGYQFSMV